MRGPCQQGSPALGLLTHSLGGPCLPSCGGTAADELSFCSSSYQLSLSKERNTAPLDIALLKIATSPAWSLSSCFGSKKQWSRQEGFFNFHSTNTHPIFSYWRGKRSGKGLKESHTGSHFKGKARADSYPCIWIGKEYKSQHIPFPCIGTSLVLYFH